MQLRQFVFILLTVLWLGGASVLPVAAMPEHAGHPHHRMETEVSPIFPFNEKAESFFNQGLDRLQVKNHEGAIAAFSESLKIAPDYRVYLERGKVYAQIGEWQQAIADYTEALMMNPDADSYVHGLRGLAWEKVGNFEAAISDYTQQLTIYPNDGVGYTRRGILYAHLKNFSEASRDLDAALQLNDTKAEAYLAQGELRSQMGNVQGALVDYQRAIELFTEQGKLEAAQTTTLLLEQLQRIPLSLPVSSP
ncbi:MAG: tetratricopeptide repeat protein [Scytolyngbya sp. HA4215-MV1]|jgi:tetratricopeptide (TPR) repeat protein|nr:tetratricopeptide repeat protein [Scytolyngbya sp. HA4215-MV1]